MRLLIVGVHVLCLAHESLKILRACAMHCVSVIPSLSCQVDSSQRYLISWANGGLPNEMYIPDVAFRYGYPA